VVDWELGPGAADLRQGPQLAAPEVVLQEVARAPGIKKLRLSGELNTSQLAGMASTLAAPGPAGDVVLDVVGLSSRDGSEVRLLSRVADQLAGRGRLYVLVADGPVLLRIEESGLERHHPHLRIVRHP